MTRDSSEILTEFLDGELVDSTELAATLSAPGSRDMLIDFVLLRSAITQALPVPSSRFYAAMTELLQTPRAVAPSWGWRGLAALAASLLLITGVWIGVSVSGSGDHPQRAETKPPAATREVAFTEGVDWFRSPTRGRNES